MARGQSTSVVSVLTPSVSSTTPSSNVTDPPSYGFCFWNALDVSQLPDPPLDNPDSSSGCIGDEFYKSGCRVGTVTELIDLVDETRSVGVNVFFVSK